MRERRAAKVLRVSALPRAAKAEPADQGRLVTREARNSRGRASREARESRAARAGQAAANRAASRPRAVHAKSCALLEAPCAGAP